MAATWLPQCPVSGMLARWRGASSNRLGPFRADWLPPSPRRSLSRASGNASILRADPGFGARATQCLLGKLADEGITKPHAIGVTGISYGGGQSMELAFLRDHIRLRNGNLAPWRSPDGKPLSIAAAF